ncbi:cysteine/glutathione ABC transporter permease/ATP-binding protein CydD [Paramixta manurensis]|uniref:ABC-type xenobiotic transporter n=1 Tax=Paramixta manurensis TaxID=2740817 RepID=A0A6M8UID9_9GAMM|nr:cysteine/glutathione ABC transporter permease/ATP-binding protein CydD [Erwiniaceae bacterium PD-1]
MNKTRQQELTRWLRAQSTHARRWLRLSSLLGLMSALLIIAQAWLLARLLQQLIVVHQPREQLYGDFLALLLCFVIRALIGIARERVGFRAGQQIRRTLRAAVLDRLNTLGPAWIQGKPAGSWATLLLEQIEDMQDYYARYLPQMSLATLVPAFILVALLPINWAAALILLVTAPLIPLFMALVGMGAADANRRNFLALSRLSGDFLDRLRGMEVLRLFWRAKAETASIGASSEEFRRRTMDVLRLAFLSSAVLEFFASLSIAFVAVYFGFSYLGEFHFGHYGHGVTLFAGFLALILAPEFFQPLRDLGTFYHAKAQAVGAADALQTFLHHSANQPRQSGEQPIAPEAALTIDADALVIIAPNGTVLAGPLTFHLPAGKRVALVGQSGAGKTSLLQALLGFLPYQGSLKVNGVELRELHQQDWHRLVAWVGQNPHLPGSTLRENILSGTAASEIQLQQVIEDAGVDEFLDRLPAGLESMMDDGAAQLSVGQAQRIAVARALLKPAKLLLLDEPGASLDADSENRVTAALLQASYRHTTLLVTHQLDRLAEWDEIWVMRDGQLLEQGTYAQLAASSGAFAALLAQRQGAIK